MVRVHAVATAGNGVPDERKAERTAAVLVALELCDGRLGRLGRVKANDTGAARAARGLVLNLSLLNLADGRKELDKILIRRRPRQLRCSR